MSQVTSPADGGPRCKHCEVVLISPDNWSPSNEKQNSKICRNCQNIRAKERYQQTRGKKMTEEQKAHAKILKYRDEERIRRLVERIQTVNLDMAKNDLLQKYRKNAAENQQTPEDAERAAIEISKNWTYSEIRNTRMRKPEHVIIPQVLFRFQVYDRKEGDSLNTWWIALNACGYDYYELDDNGLPLARPGVLRLQHIKEVVKKADKMSGRRIGLTLAKCREPDRRPRLESRLILARGETGKKVYDEKDALMKSRRFGEDSSMAELLNAIALDEIETRSTIDILAELFKRTG